jgi:hypothetical protein
LNHEIDSSLIDPGTASGAVATGFPKQVLVIVSVILRTLRPSAFARISPMRPGFSQRR